VTESKGGRPSIGKQVSVTIPTPVLDQVDGMARAANITRADVLREIVVSGVRARVGTGDTPLEESLAPIAETLAEWVGAGDEGTAKGRFILYRSKAGNPFQLAQIFQTAYGQAVLDGHHPRVPKPAALDLVIGKGHDGWRARTVLMFMVINYLIDRGIKVRSDEGEDEAIDFGPEPDDEEYE